MTFGINTNLLGKETPEDCSAEMYASILSDSIDTITNDEDYSTDIYLQSVVYLINLQRAKCSNMYVNSDRFVQNDSEEIQTFSVDYTLNTGFYSVTIMSDVLAYSVANNQRCLEDAVTTFGYVVTTTFLVTERCDLTFTIATEGVSAWEMFINIVGS